MATPNSPLRDVGDAKIQPQSVAAIELRSGGGIVVVLWQGAHIGIPDVTPDEAERALWPDLDGA